MHLCDLFVTLLFYSFVLGGRNYYDILGVSKNATAKQIKLSYLEKAKKLHPDVNSSPDAEEQFQDLGKAYSVLSKPKDREIYDKYGEDGLDQQHQRPGGFDDFMNPFSNFFNGFFHSNEERELKGNDVKVPLQVTLEEMYEGTFVEFLRIKYVYEAASGTRKCNCRTEMGTTRQGNAIYLTPMQFCDECPNKKLARVEEMVEIEIENGSKDGTSILLRHQGEPHIEAEPGDLIIVLRQIPHSTFERKGDDLFTNVTVSLIDSLLGFTANLTHLDSHEVFVDRRGKITPHGSVLRIPKEGMPIFQRYGTFGDLFVTFNVLFPERGFSNAERKVLLDIFGTTDSPAFYNGLLKNRDTIYL